VRKKCSACGSIKWNNSDRRGIVAQVSFNIDDHEIAVSGIASRILFVNERRKIGENYDHGSRRSRSCHEIFVGRDESQCMWADRIEMEGCFLNQAASSWNLAAWYLRRALENRTSAFARARDIETYSMHVAPWTLPLLKPFSRRQINVTSAAIVKRNTYLISGVLLSIDTHAGSSTRKGRRH